MMTDADRIAPETPIEAIGAVVLYLQDCHRTKVKPSESEIATVAVRAADQARGLRSEFGLANAPFAERDQPHTISHDSRTLAPWVRKDQLMVRRYVSDWRPVERPS